MVYGGEIDVLTGDWLAELTMSILAKQRQATRPAFAMTFLRQLEDVLQTCVERGVKVVSNAGGLDPGACAEAVRQLALRLGVAVRVAHVEGDDLVPRLEELSGSGAGLRHLDPDRELPRDTPITANAYLGGWGIARALSDGADVVVTGRVTDAALAVGPAVWRFGWAPDDWDRLAGAVVAGHVIECGAQATGGNYAFFRDVPVLERCGFPIAEIRQDGSSVITKHEHSAGMVTVGTVTAQLLYEIGGHRYANPDVTARFDTIQLQQFGRDRVLVRGVRGEPPSPDLKVAITYHGGYRNEMTAVLTEPDVPEKARVAVAVIDDLVKGGLAAFERSHVELIGLSSADSDSQLGATSLLRIAVRDPDEARVGRAFSAAVVESGLSSYPGLYFAQPPRGASAFALYMPGLVPRGAVEHTVVFEGRRIPIGSPVVAAAPQVDDPAPPRPSVDVWGPTRRMRLGDVVGARSGDKGSDANVGVWVAHADAYPWLVSFLTVERFKALVPDTAELAVRRHDLPNLRALNFVVAGYLWDGVASCLKLDAQAKALGEFLRSRRVEVPESVAAVTSPL